jgi:putative tryptophan/tyrosine transport system substrate-binding protein
LTRRESITLLAWGGDRPASYGAAQQRMPLVGFLNSASPDTYRFNADLFSRGLTKAGFVEGRNLIE